MKMTGSALYCLGIAIVCATFFSCGNGGGVTNAPHIAGLVTYPEKKEMILVTDRPPQLETPLKIFRQDITPNEYFFVRWHLSQILTKIDMDTFRLRIGGAVDNSLSLSI